MKRKKRRLLSKSGDRTVYSRVLLQMEIDVFFDVKTGIFIRCAAPSGCEIGIVNASSSLFHYYTIVYGYVSFVVFCGVYTDAMKNEDSQFLYRAIYARTSY